MESCGGGRLGRREKGSVPFFQKGSVPFFHFFPSSSVPFLTVSALMNLLHRLLLHLKGEGIVF
jgi:hypothetical protein